MEKMQLELSRKAQTNLDDIPDYSIATSGLDRAIAYLDAVEATFRRILSFPEIGAFDPVVPVGLRSLGCQRHRIFYSVNEDRILIVRILHQSMDTNRHF